MDFVLEVFVEFGAFFLVVFFFVLFEKVPSFLDVVTFVECFELVLDTSEAGLYFAVSWELKFCI